MAHRTWVPQALWLAFSNIPSPEPPTREVLRSRGIVSHWAQPLKSPFHRAQPTAQEMNGAILSFFLQFLIFSNFLTSLNYSDNQRKDLSFFMLRKLNTKWSLLTHVLLLQTTVKVKSIVEGVTFSSRHKIKTHQLSLSSASITPHSNSSLLKKSFNKKKKKCFNSK